MNDVDEAEALVDAQRAEITERLATKADHEILIRYIADENHYGASLPGVPGRDLTKAEFMAYPDWLQRSIVVVKFYEWS